MLLFPLCDKSTFQVPNIRPERRFEKILLVVSFHKIKNCVPLLHEAAASDRTPARRTETFFVVTCWAFVVELPYNILSVVTIRTETPSITLVYSMSALGVLDKDSCTHGDVVEEA